MKRYLLTVLTFALMVPAFFTVRAQATDAEKTIRQGQLLFEKAYKSYDDKLMTEARGVFQKLYESDKSNTAALYNMTFTEYKLLEMSLRGAMDEAFDIYYDRAVENAEKISMEKGWESEGKVLQSAIHMMKIAKNSMTAVALAPKILGLLDEAEKINPSNPRTYIIRGYMKYNTPGVFGGSFKLAAENFRKAISIFEKEDTAFTVKPSWGYLEALTWLGRSLVELDSLDSAKYFYQKVLSVEPEFGYVKYFLLPELEKKMKNGK